MRIHDDHPEASTIVLRAIRRHLAATESSIKGYRNDPSKCEEIDESIRRIRVAKCATSIIGFAPLNRLLSLQEDVLESVVVDHGPLDHDAFSLLTTLTLATNAYIDSQESASVVSEDQVDEARNLVTAGVKAYRRYCGHPDDEDDQAITELFREPCNSIGTRAHRISGQGSGASQLPTEKPDDQSCTAGPGTQELQDNVSPELLEVFKDEAEEHINKIYAGLGALAKDQTDRHHLKEVRRAAHTFKGAAGAVGLRSLSKLSHRMEDILDELYDGQRELSQDCLALLLETTDVLQDSCLNEAEDVSESTARVRQLTMAYDALRGESTPLDSQTPRVEQATDSPRRNETSTPTGIGKSAGTEATSSTRTLRVPSHCLDDVRNVVSELMINRASLEQTLERFVKCADDFQPVLDRMRAVCHQLETQYEVPALMTPVAAKSEWMTANNDRAATCNRDAEFDELELDRYTISHLLSRSVDETTSDTCAISHDLRKVIDDLETLLVQQSRLTRQAQTRLLKIRMVEFGSIASRLDRVVREVAGRQNKNVELVIEGADTELDKTVLEEMVDPLLHLLRNSVDHGVESPDLRATSGKPTTAQVKISASHYGTQVVIRISDDGKGLDANHIRDGIVQGGYLDAMKADSLAPEELYPYIFIPGFSTASHVSEISGRGVGMDVVRSNIERLKGNIEIDSSPGKGTTFTIRLPTTLVVTRALIAVTDNERFAIPTHALAKIGKVDPDQISQSNGETRVRIDGADYRLVRLDNHLAFRPVNRPSVGTLTTALVKLGENKVALSIDKILSTRDIVVKDLGSHLGKVRGLLGVTVLGDGAVVPILDPVTLTECPKPTAIPQASYAAEWDDVSVLIVDDSVSVRRALSNLIQYGNWTPITARDGVEALEIIGDLDKPPQVVLLDVEMPRMDGYELLSALRNKPEFKLTPIIMITSRAGEKHRRKAVELGATAYVVKPFEDEALLQLIQRHVSQLTSPVPTENSNHVGS